MFFATFILILLSSFRQDRTNIIIVVEPVGLVGNRKNAGVAAAGLKAVGSKSCQPLLNGTMQAAPVFAKSTGQELPSIDNVSRELLTLLQDYVN